MHLVRAELVKVRTTRLWVGLLIGGLGLAALGTILLLVVTASADAARNGLAPIRTADDMRGLVFSAAGSLAFVLVLAATMATAEFRYGTAAGTYLATPDRVRVITAKTLAAVPAGFAYGAAAAVLSVLIAAVWFAVRGDALPFGTPVASAIAQVGLQSAYAAAIGVCVGMALRSQLVAILVLLGWVLLAEPLVTGLMPRFAKWTPLTGVQGVFGNAGDAGRSLLGPAGAGLLAVAYVALFWTAAIWLEGRRDV